MVRRFNIWLLAGMKGLFCCGKGDVEPAYTSTLNSTEKIGSAEPCNNLNSADVDNSSIDVKSIEVTSNTQFRATVVANRCRLGPHDVGPKKVGVCYVRAGSNVEIKAFWHPACSSGRHMVGTGDESIHFRMDSLFEEASKSVPGEPLVITGAPRKEFQLIVEPRPD